MAEAKGLNYSGSMQGQIKTPMSDKNVDNKGDGKVHSYKGVANTDQEGGKASIKGPGAQGKWDASINISGNNLKY